VGLGVPCKTKNPASCEAGFSHFAVSEETTEGSPRFVSAAPPPVVVLDEVHVSFFSNGANDIKTFAALSMAPAPHTFNFSLPAPFAPLAAVCATIPVERRSAMAQFIEAINKMNVTERMQVLEYLCSALAPHFAETTPEWHDEELRKTEELVAAGEDSFMSLEESKRRFAESAYAR